MIGVALNFKTDETLAWAVLALTTDKADGPIAGNYVGASANVALGFGVDSHILIGGFNNSIALQPISVAGPRGLGVLAGVERLNLTFTGNNLMGFLKSSVPRDGVGTTAGARARA